MHKSDFCSVVMLLISLMSCSTAAGEPPSATTTKIIRKQYDDNIAKLQDELNAKFEAAVDMMMKKGDLEAVLQLKKEAVKFNEDKTALPTHPSMILHRFNYETKWLEAKYKYEKDLKNLVAELTKAQKISEAIEVKELLSNASDLSLIPKDVSTQLPGEWRVKFVYPNNATHEANWLFDSEGKVRTSFGVSGKWSYDCKRHRVWITWENSDKSWEALPIPLNTSGMKGETWNQRTKFTLFKIKK